MSGIFVGTNGLNNASCSSLHAQAARLLLPPRSLASCSALQSCCLNSSAQFGHNKERRVWHRPGSSCAEGALSRPLIGSNPNRLRVYKLYTISREPIRSRGGVMISDHCTCGIKEAALTAWCPRRMSWDLWHHRGALVWAGAAVRPGRGPRSGLGGGRGPAGSGAGPLEQPFPIVGHKLGASGSFSVPADTLRLLTCVCSCLRRSDELWEPAEAPLHLVLILEEQTVSCNQH